MKWLYINLAWLAFLGDVALGDVPLGQFTLSEGHGNIVSACRSGQVVLAPCFDQYLLQSDTLSRSDEREDEVLSRRKTPNGVVFECRNRTLGIQVTKAYGLTGDGALAKTITVQPLAVRGELHVRSVVAVEAAFRQKAFYYSPRQSWPPGSPEKQLSGVQPATKFAREVVSGSMWDNRLVAAFLPSGGGLGHYRYAVNGQHVMPSCVTGRFYGSDPHALTYTPAGWSFEAFHMLDGDRSPISATLHYYLTPGDFLDVWKHFRAQPEQHAWEELPVQPWCSQVKIGNFWDLVPSIAGDNIAEFHAATKRLGGAILPIAFAWGLDGDYDTEGLFINEWPTVAFTPSWIKRNVAAIQSNPQCRAGMYIQANLIDSISKTFAKHPEWVLTDAAGKPMDSNFRDHPAGNMYYINPLDQGWVGHYLSRVKAVCEVYQPGWIYCDGGLDLETSDFRSRRAVLSDAWNYIYRRQYEVAHASGAERAVLLNAQNFPYADMYWLESSFFNPSTPWRETIEFCFDTAVLRTPRRPMIALGWNKGTEERYLAMCAAFGFTPCATFVPVSGVSEKGWRVVDVANAMRAGEMILSSRITDPIWWKDDTTTVCFPTRVGDLLVVPVLNFGTESEVSISINTKESGMKVGDHVWLVHPFVSGQDIDLGMRPAGDKAAFRLKIPPGFEGLRLLVLGGHKLL